MGKEPLPVPTEATELLRLHRIAQDRRGNQPNSIDKREQYLSAFARWLEPRGMFEANRQDIELFLDKRMTPEGRKIQSRTRYYWIAHFHAFYDWAVKEELATTDPTVTIVRPKQRRTLPRPIDDDDLVMAIRSARPQMKAMLSLAAFAGLRCQEIAGLDRDDVIEAKGLIRVRRGKGDKERIVPLHPDVMESLRCLPLPRTGAIFTRPREGRYSPNWMSACIGRYLHEMGINASAHQARHWFATELEALPTRITLASRRQIARLPTVTPGSASTARRSMPWRTPLSSPGGWPRSRASG